MQLNSLPHQRLLIVGFAGAVHVGTRMGWSAERLGLPMALCDATPAFRGMWPIVKLNWWLRGRRLPGLRQYCRSVMEVCHSFRPTCLLATGLAPLDARTLQEVGRMGIIRMNYLTDDPWNPTHGSKWFLQALPSYDYLFSPRRANLEDLRRQGCQNVSYLPFAYSPELQFPEPPATPEESALFSSDVLFAGGPDRDRVPYIAALIRGGFQVALYGAHWERFPETRAQARGQADLQTLRKAVSGAKVSLCLVRRANRDGHSMRSYETPAIGACMLTEDTREHREIFGEEGKAVVYFRGVPEMIEKLRWLLDRPEERCRLATAARALIVDGRNTYDDRLATMLALAGGRS